MSLLSAELQIGQLFVSVSQRLLPVRSELQACAKDCEECTSDKCTKCRTGLIVFEQDCVKSCALGFKQTASGTCEEGDITPPVAVLSVSPDNSLFVAFDKEMDCVITALDVSVETQCGSSRAIEVAWEDPNFSGSRTMVIKLAFTATWLPAGCSVTLDFLSPHNVTDVFGVPISDSLYRGTLNPFGESPTPQPAAGALLQGSAAQAAAAATKGGVSAGAATSLLNGSPVGLISLVNQLQLVTYLAMSKLPLSPDFASTLAALNVGSMIPNPLSKYTSYNDSANAAPKFIQDYGVETTVFVTNSISFLGTCVFVLGSYGPIYLLSRSKIDFISQYFKKMLPSFMWGIPIRLWLTSYLDMGVFALMHLRFTASPFEGVLSGSSSVLAGLVALVFAATPVVLTAFMLRNFNYISSRSDSNFNLGYGTLFLEFKQSLYVSSIAFFPFFALRRTVLAFSLIFASDLLGLFAVLNCSLGVITFLYLVIFRPFESRISQIEAILIEASTCVLYLIAGSFLLNIEDNARTVLTVAGVWVVRLSIAMNVTISVVRSGVSALTLFKLYKERMKLVKAKYQVREELSAKKAHECSNLTTAESSPMPISLK